MEIIKWFIIFIIITLTFVIYSEYSVGQIFLRPDSNGKITMNFNSLFGYLMNPFYKRDLWTWQTLDINYVFILIYSFFIFYLF